MGTVIFYYIISPYQIASRNIYSIHCTEVICRPISVSSSKVQNAMIYPDNLPGRMAPNIVSPYQFTSRNIHSVYCPIVLVIRRIEVCHTIKHQPQDSPPWRIVSPYQFPIHSVHSIHSTIISTSDIHNITRHLKVTLVFSFCIVLPYQFAVPSIHSIYNTVIGVKVHNAI